MDDSTISWVCPLAVEARELLVDTTLDRGFDLGAASPPERWKPPDTPPAPQDHEHDHAPATRDADEREHPRDQS